MGGLELNPHLLAAGARFVRETRAAPVYRRWSIGDRHPAMLRVTAGGVAVAVEVWDVPPAGVADALMKEPPGLCIGKISLDDHIGPLARSTRDLALAFDALQGPDPRDPVCTRRPPTPCSPELARGADGLRIAVADGHFAKGGAPECHEAVARVASVLKVDRRATLPEAHRARAAAFVITTSEGAQLHLESLRARAQDFDPLIRDRFLAGALVPAVLEHWERRNGTAMQRMDPRKLDRTLLTSLVEKYGDSDIVGALQARDGWPDNDTTLTGGIDDLDDFAACRITRKEDWVDLYAKPFYFGCEADDRTNGWAFSPHNPFGAKLNALYSSDIGHFDVVDMRDPLAEAYELVEDGVISRDNFRDFTFANAVHLWGTQNPRFFEGTAVAKAAAAELARGGAG